MQPSRPRAQLGLAPVDHEPFPWGVEFREDEANQVTLHPPRSYRQAFGDEPIRVGLIEFRIMLFLSRWPYHAFTQRQIAEAVSAQGQVVMEQAIDDHIASLRNQLGVLHDFVQSVPHVGYRFKA